MTADFLERANFAIKLAALLVACFGVWKYFDEQSTKRHEAQQQNSLDLVQRFENDLQRSTLEIELALLPFSSTFGAGLLTRSENLPVSIVELGILFDSAMISGLDRSAPQPLLAQWKAAISYFETARVCSVAEICDTQTLKSLLCPHVRDLFELSDRFIEVYRERFSSAKFGTEFENFYNDCSAV